MTFKKLTTAHVMAMLLLSFGCGGYTTETLAKEVQTSIEQTWTKNPELATAKITSFTLVHKDGNQYKGFLEAEQHGSKVNLTVDVTYDGKTFMWEIVQ